MTILNSKAFISMVMVIGMLSTGTLNTILSKLQSQVVVDCKKFEQPLWQSFVMFAGEVLCLIVYNITMLFKRDDAKSSTASTRASTRNINDDEERFDEKDSLIDIIDDSNSKKKQMTFLDNFLLILPTMCDVIGTTLMMVGLFFVSASIYQMLRGAIVLSTGILSVIILKAKMPPKKIIALFAVMVGVFIVGVSPILFPSEDPPQVTEKSCTTDETVSSNSNPYIGVIAIMIAQLFAALQFIIEEIIVIKYDASPLKMVGLEGVFGLTITTIIMIILQFTVVGKHDLKGFDFFDSITGAKMILNNPFLLGTFIASAISIAFYNFFGLNITRYVNATSRTTIDTCRTLFIWLFFLITKEEVFNFMELIGFMVLVYGTFVFNGVIEPIPFLKRRE